MKAEWSPVGRHLENQAQIEREHLEIGEKSNTELRAARAILQTSDRLRNSRFAVAGLFTGLAILVGIDITEGDDIPEPIGIAMDASQIVIAGGLIGAASRPASRTADLLLRNNADSTFNDVFKGIDMQGHHEFIIGEGADGEKSRLTEIRETLSQYGDSLKKDNPEKRPIGASTGNVDVDSALGAISLALSYEKDGEIMSPGMVENYIERGVMNTEDRKDSRLGIFDKIKSRLVTDKDKEDGKKRVHSSYLDGLTLMCLEAQVLAERKKQEIGVMQKKAAVILGDFAIGIASMYGLVATASVIAGDNYKGLAYFADDAVSMVGIALAPAFRRLFSTQTAQDVKSSMQMDFKLAKEFIKEAVTSRFRKE